MSDIDGLSLNDAVQDLEHQGFTGQFGSRQDAMVVCFTCHVASPASSLNIEAQRRVEGASDPDDMSLIAGLHCPHCHAHGTLVLHFGPEASGEDIDVLSALPQN